MSSKSIPNICSIGGKYIFDMSVTIDFAILSAPLMLGCMCIASREGEVEEHHFFVCLYIHILSKLGMNGSNFKSTEREV